MAMDTKFAFYFLLLILSSTLFITIQAVEPYQEIRNQPKPSRINVGKISTLLSDKGYHAMALTLETTLEALIQTQLKTHNTTLTLFCPQDHAFFNSKYPQPPFTLLKYHVVPFKIDQDTFKAPNFGHSYKVDTLLPGHPLVVTSLPGAGGLYASLNQVKVTEWDLYNDGRLIVHGVEDFFDPAFQTLRYPQYDSVIAKEVPSGDFSWLKSDAPNIISLFLLLVLVAAFACLLIRPYCTKPHGVVEYAPLQF